MQSINTVDLQKLMRTRSISKYHFQYRYVVFFEITRDYYATSASLSLSLSLSLDPEDLRRLARPNQGQTGIPRINLESERPTLRPMPRKNITIHHECPCRIEISRPLIAKDKLFPRQNAVRNFLIPST